MNGNSNHVNPTPLLDHFAGRSIFVLGGCGSLATTFCYKLILCTRVAHIYLLVTGGAETLWKTWETLLEADQVETLRNSNCITVLDGDECNGEGTLGIADEALVQQVRSVVSIIVNLYPGHRLISSLSEIKSNSIDSALHVADFAMTCPALESFVWASSAYANSHLHMQHNDSVTAVQEAIYHPSNSPLQDLQTQITTTATLLQMTPEQVTQTEAEYLTLGKTGTTLEYSACGFFSHSCYAKNLTERLLISRYAAKGNCKPGTVRHDLPNLLIFRPSCIGPALREPYRTFEMMSETPVTTLMSFIVCKGSDRTVLLPTRHVDGLGTVVDEIPVDLCVNQLIGHISVGTSGIVHAINGAHQSLKLRDYFQEYLTCVPYSQRPTIEWVNDEMLKIPEAEAEVQLEPIVRELGYLGVSFSFSNENTHRVWNTMGEHEKTILPFFVDGKDELTCALRLRRKRTGQEILKEFTQSDFLTGVEQKATDDQRQSRLTQLRESGINPLLAIEVESTAQRLQAVQALPIAG